MFIYRTLQDIFENKTKQKINWECRLQNCYIFLFFFAESTSYLVSFFSPTTRKTCFRSTMNKNPLLCIYYLHLPEGNAFLTLEPSVDNIILCRWRNRDNNTKVVRICYKERKDVVPTPLTKSIIFFFYSILRTFVG